MEAIPISGSFSAVLTQLPLFIAVLVMVPILIPLLMKIWHAVVEIIQARVDHRDWEVSPDDDLDGIPILRTRDLRRNHR